MIAALLKPIRLEDDGARACLRSLALLGLVLLAFRLLLLAAAPAGPLRATPEPRGDAVGYLALAGHLVDTHWTSYRIEGDSVDQRRPPTLPVVLGAFVAVTGEGRPLFAAWSVFQIACSALSVLLAAWCALRLGLTLSPLALGLLAALDLLSLVFATEVLTESLYTLLFAASLACAVESRAVRRAWPLAAASGALLALAVLARPVGLFFLPCTVGVLWILHREAPAKGRAVLVAACLPAFALPVAGWAARNHAVHGRAFLSEISAVALYRYWAPGVEAATTGRPIEVVTAEWDARLSRELAGEALLDARTRQDFFRREALATICEDPSALLSFPVPAAYRIFTGRATARLNDLFEQPPVGIGGHLRQRNSLPHLALVLGEVVALAAVYLLIAVALWKAWRRPALGWPLLLLLLPVAVHFAVSWGPESTARFRVPLMPWLLVVAAVGAASFVRRPNPDAPANSP